MLYHTEMFAHFVYSPDLSYYDLHELEEELKDFFSKLLEENGASYINFEALGDTLRTQCAFMDFEESLFHRICDELSPELKADIEARLLFVDKGLGTLALYYLSKNTWRESMLKIPPTEPIGKKLKKENLDNK